MRKKVRKKVTNLKKKNSTTDLIKDNNFQFQFHPRGLPPGLDSLSIDR